MAIGRDFGRVNLSAVAFRVCARTRRPSSTILQTQPQTVTSSSFSAGSASFSVGSERRDLLAQLVLNAIHRAARVDVRKWNSSAIEVYSRSSLFW